MSAELAPGRASSARREGTVAMLRRAFRLNLQRLSIPALGIGGALLFFAIDAMTPGPPGPRELARLFAPVPLDAYSTLSAGGGWLIAVVLILLRSLIVSAFVCRVLGRKLPIAGVINAAAVYLAGAASIILFFFLGQSYLQQKASLSAASGNGLVALIILAAVPLLHMTLAVVLAPMASRAAVGDPLRLRLGDRRIWILAAVATWIWMFGSRRVGAVYSEGEAAIAFALAFVALFAQCVVLTAIVLRSVAEEETAAASATRESKIDLIDRSVA